MEYRDIYDKNKQLTGKIFEKSDGVPEGYFYLMVVCFMQNNKGQFLMQKRVPEKDGKWATTGGHPKAGENSLTGMITEIKEELGINVNPNELQLFKEAKGKNSFCDLYYLKKDIDIKDITIHIYIPFSLYFLYVYNNKAYDIITSIISKNMFIFVPSFFLIYNL